MIYNYTGKHLHLYLGNVNHSELWLIEPYIICSNNNYLRQELRHLQHVFHTQNCYPMWVIKQIMKKIKENSRALVATQIDTALQKTSNDKKIHSLMLPLAGAKGNTMLKSMKRCIKRIAPNNINKRFTYTGHKINSRYQVKDETDQT